jgi:hypothetical protein
LEKSFSNDERDFLDCFNYQELSREIELSFPA